MKVEDNITLLNKKAAENIQIIIFFGIFSKILSFINQTLLASRFGSSFKTDAYFIAFAGATLVADLIGEGISNSMVPVLLKIEAKEGKDKKVEYVNNLLHIAIFFSIILIILGWIFSPIIIKILAKGFKGECFNLAVKLMKIGLPATLFIFIRSVFIGFAQSNHAFKAGAKSWLYYNTVYILFLIFYYNYGFTGLMIAGILASTSQLLTIIPTVINMGYKYRRIFNLKDIYLKETFIMLIPIVVALGINKINLVIDKTIASTLATGSISKLKYANDIIQLIFGLFITAVVTVFFPVMSEEYNKGNTESTKETMIKGINLIIVISVPITVILVTLAEPIVKLLFERGAFDQEATYITYQALIYYALGLGSMALVLILTKIHYAMHDAFTPMKYGFMAVFLNLILDIYLSKHMGAKGLALATSISTTALAFLLIKNLNNKTEAIDKRKSVIGIVKLLLAIVVMAIVTLITFKTLTKLLGNNPRENAIKLLGSIIVGLGFYISLCKKSSLCEPFKKQNI